MQWEIHPKTTLPISANWHTLYLGVRNVHLIPKIMQDTSDNRNPSSSETLEKSTASYEYVSYYSYKIIFILPKENTAVLLEI